MVSAVSEWLAEVLEALASNPRDAGPAVAEHLARLGLTRVIYTLRTASGAPCATSFTTMPGWWRRDYSRPRVFERDPFFTYCCDRFDHTFTGPEFVGRYDYLPPAAREFIQSSSESGFRAGIAVPMRLRGEATVGGWNIGGDLSAGELTRIWDQRGLEIRLALAYAHDRLQQPALKDTVLTPRERECLLGLADGDQLKQIAERLGVGYSTVEFHLRNARRKLGARTREQALARALAAGLIELGPRRP